MRTSYPALKRRAGFQMFPVTANFLPPFAPTSDQPWLTITGITNGVLSFSFLFNPGTNRSANITVLGRAIPVTQAGANVTPPNLANSKMLGNGTFQFSFTNSPGSSFTVLTTTNVALPLSNWTVLGAPTEGPPGNYQFTDAQATNKPTRFYSVESP